MAVSVLNDEKKLRIILLSKEMCGSDIAKIIGVSKGVVNGYIKKKGLSPSKDLLSQWKSEKMKRPFTKEQDGFIIKELPNSSIKKIALQLKKTCGYVVKRARELGLGHIIEKNRIESQIKKGNVPINKGLKREDYMLPEQIEKTKATRFKKGQIPANTKESDGYISIRHEHPSKNNGRSYKYIRISIGKWMPLHTHLWEKVNGKVPAGMCLWFKNGDSLNCELDNLELITRRENIRRNNGEFLSDNWIAGVMSHNDRELRQEIKKHPKLIEVKRQSIILKRQIDGVQSKKT